VFQGAASDETSGLEEYLESAIMGHLVFPISSCNRPLHLLIATSASPYYSFPPIDVNIVRSVSSVLRAKADQQRVILADAAKTSFLSSVSHELRTPMHGVQASLDLVRKAVDRRDWEEIIEPLEMAEASGHSLLNILNDVLDFGKKDWAKQKAVMVNLARSAREIASVCLTQYRDSLGKEAQLFMDWEDRD